MKKSIIVALFILVAVCHFSPVAAADLPIPNGGRVTVELIFSDAQFRNTLSLNSPTASIASSGCKLEAADGLGGLRLLSEKQSQRGCRVDLDADPATAGIQGFPANSTLEFRFCAQTDGDAACEFVWSSNPANNSDNFDHVRTTPLFPANFPGQIFQLAWEDKENGGDQDFNDLIAVVRVQGDADSDGLWDDWEQFGIDTNGDGTPDFDLPALGANPNRRNIFLEIDFMDCATAGGDCAAGDTHSHRPKAAAVQAVIDAFANAPITNPDGSTGITLRVDVGNAIAHQNFLAVGCGFGDAGFNAVKADPANFGTTDPRRFVYHYALFNHRQANTTSSSGCGELPGNDFIVSLGEWNTICVGPGANRALNTTPTGDDTSDGTVIYAGPNLTCNTTANATAPADDVQFIAVGNAPAADRDLDGIDDRTVGTIQQQAGTLMHEFGHNLNLRHGGDEGVNYKPNYISIMNYAFQTDGIPPTDPDGAGPLRARIDYSSADLADLNENNLNEPAGIGDGADRTLFTCPGGAAGGGPGTGPIDWNCDGDGGIDTGLPAININNDFDAGGNPITDTLTGFNDWANLKLDFQNTDDFEDGVHQTTVDLVEIDQFVASQIPAIVDLSLEKTDTPDPVSAGSMLTYNLTVVNHGPASASDVVVADTLPAGVTYVSASGSCDTASLPTLTCTLGEVPAGESRMIAIQVLVAPDLVYRAGGPTTITNVSAVTTSSADTDLANNDDAEPTLVVAVADLAIVSFTPVTPPSQILVGQPVTINLRKVIKNRGPSAPMDVTLTRTATAPADSVVTPTSASSTAIGLGLNEERTVDEAFTVKCNGYSHHLFTFTNAIQPANAADTDPNQANNTASVTLDIECVVPVKIDVQPSQINLSGNGVVPVKIFKTAAGEAGLPLAFNPATIDPKTVRFGPRDVVWAGTGGAAEIHSTDHSGGNSGQRLYHFRAQETGLQPSNTEACMKGTWYDAAGQPHTFFGCVSVTVKGQARNANSAAGEAAADEPANNNYLPLIQR